MQNYKYYATINAQNEKRIFNNSKDYVVYRNKNRTNINCKGFNDINEAYDWLNNNDYIDYKREQRESITWTKYPQVFTSPIENCNKEDAYVKIYVNATRNRDTGDGAYGIVMTSPQYTNIYTSSHYIPANKVIRGVSDALTGIIHACRLAYDNGFRNIYVYTTCQHAVNWLNGSWQAKCDAAVNYLLAMNNLIVDKKCIIYPVLLNHKNTSTPKESFDALNLAKNQVQN